MTPHPAECSGAKKDTVMPTQQRLQQFAQLAAVAIVIIGCYLVLMPFIPAILFAVVVCIATWPLYVRLRGGLRGNSTLAALLMMLLLVALVIAPTALLAFSLSDNVAPLADALRAFLNHGASQPPVWLKDIPLVGTQLDGYWQQLAADREAAVALFKRLLNPAKDFLLVSGKTLGHSLLQMTFAAFIGFFFFRDGDALLQTLRAGLEKLSGPVGTELLATIHGTVAGVVHGIFGTALAQALVAWVGFLIAGVPGAFLLAVATFFLSVVPVGPPLIWGGAIFWLIRQDATGWAIFMALWGFFVISSIDNLVKPYLISRGSGLPLLPIVLGVFGGIAAFGFIGVFIGPPLLAVGLTLVRLWVAPSVKTTVSGSAPPPGSLPDSD
jgi:predicted PurR-regulated permease PerM